MNALIERFLQYERFELNHSELTVVSYRRDLEQFERFLPSLGVEALEQATTAHVRAWVVQRSGQGDCARTIRRRVQSLRSFYKWLMRQGVLQMNPAADVELARAPKRLPQLVRPQSMDDLLALTVDVDDFRAVRDRLVVLMLYSTGIRRAELIGLLDAWVDTASCQLRVHGKRDKDRIVPFGPELCRWIELYRQLRDRDLGKGCTAFFVKDDGEPLYPSLVYRIVHTALMQVGGATQLSPHVLRHSFASAMLNDGAALASVKELLGHESLAATQIYTHVTLNELKQNYNHAHPRALKKGGRYGS